MDDAARVGTGQRIEDLAHQVQRDVDGVAALQREVVREVVARCVRKHGVEDPGRSLSRVDQRDDVRVVQERADFELAPESGDPQPGGIGLEPVVERQELDRDLLSGAALASAEHLREGAGADAIEELVALPERGIDVESAQAIVWSIHRRGGRPRRRVHHPARVVHRPLTPIGYAMLKSPLRASRVLLSMSDAGLRPDASPRQRRRARRRPRHLRRGSVSH
jgi:hypothetical protein